MKHSECHVGQDVLFHHAGVTWEAKIVKVNPKNIKVLASSPYAKRWNVHPSYLHIRGSIVGPPPAATPVPLSPTLHVGQVVKFKDGSRSKWPVLVVIGQHSGLYRIAPLGGTVDGRYYRGVDSADLEVVAFDLAGV